MRQGGSYVRDGKKVTLVSRTLNPGDKGYIDPAKAKSPKPEKQSKPEKEGK